MPSGEKLRNSIPAAKVGGGGPKPAPPRPCPTHSLPRPLPHPIPVPALPPGPPGWAQGPQTPSQVSGQ